MISKEKQALSSFGTYRLYNKHYRISIADDANVTQETGEATSLYHIISFDLAGK